MQQLRAKWIKDMYAAQSLAKQEEPNINEPVLQSFPETIAAVQRKAYEEGRADAMYSVIEGTEPYNDQLTKIEQELLTLERESRTEELEAVERNDPEAAYTALTKKQMAKQVLDKMKLLEVQPYGNPDQ